MASLLADPRLSKARAISSSEADAQVDLVARAASTKAAVADAARKARLGDDGVGGGALKGQDDEMDDEVAFEQRMRRQMQAKRERIASGGTTSQPARTVPAEGAVAAGDTACGAPSGGAVAGGVKQRNAGGAAGGASDPQAEYDRLKAELVQSRTADAVDAADGRGGGWKWRGKSSNGGGDDEDDDDDDDGDDEDTSGMSFVEQQRAKYLKKKRESAGLDKSQRQAATLAKLEMYKSKLSTSSAKVGASNDGGDSLASSIRGHALVFSREKTMAESASHYDSFDPLAHGTDASRALAKIREREKVMLSMKGQIDDD